MSGKRTKQIRSYVTDIGVTKTRDIKHAVKMAKRKYTRATEPERAQIRKHMEGY